MYIIYLKKGIGVQDVIPGAKDGYEASIITEKYRVDSNGFILIRSITKITAVHIPPNNIKMIVHT